MVRRLRISEYASAIGIVAVTTALAFALRAQLQIIDVAMIFLLAVVLVAYLHRRGPAVVASLLSLAAFDFGFVPPYYTFNVENAAFLLTFVVMLAVALSMSQLTGRIRQQADEATEREERTRAMYALSQELAVAERSEDQLAIVRKRLMEAGQGDAMILLQPGDSPTLTDAQLEELETIDLRVAARYACDSGESAGWGTNQCGEAEALVVPLRGATGTMGVVVLRPQSSDAILSERRRRLVEALVHEAALSFERAQLAERRSGIPR